MVFIIESVSSRGEMVRIPAGSRVERSRDAGAPGVASPDAIFTIMAVFSVVVPVGVQGRAGVYFEWFLSGNNEQIEWEEKNNISNNVFFRITH
jgi:hypothetical protein